MTLDERDLELIREELGRDPNATERAMFENMWSEHCAYRSTRHLLRQLPSEADHVIVGPGDDAAVVAIDDEWAVVVGIESHNHPSYVDPYNGAATGVGGIVRDVLSMGAFPIALLDPLRFGPLDGERVPYLVDGVVRGISDYGNRIGVPTVGGELEFDPSYERNPLVNVMCVGIVRRSEIVRGRADRPGDVLVLVGARTGRDGIGGAAFASEELGEESEEEDRPAVQIGDPFTERQLIIAIREAVERGLVKGCKDLGAAGLTCAATEMAADGGTGVEIDVSKVPLREEGMEPWEIMLSESQERMLLVVAPEDVDEVIEICRKYGLEASVVGRVTDDGYLTVKDGDDVIARVPAEFLADGAPEVEWEEEPYSYPEDVDVPEPDPEDLVRSVLSSPNVSPALREWVYRQYDHEVQGRTVVKPGHDAAVMWLQHEGLKDVALALTTDSNPRHVLIDPKTGTEGCVAEALRNLATVGAEPLCLVDCLNFGSPENPRVYYQLRRSIEGLGKAVREFKVPVVGGNVSLYNEHEVDGPVNPTPVIGAVGVIRGLDYLEDFPREPEEGEAVIVLGETREELGGSLYLIEYHGIKGGKVPRVRYGEERALHDLLRRIARKNMVSSVTDVSTGGLLAAVAELLGPVGASLSLSEVPNSVSRWDFLLLSESHGRAVVTTDRPDDVLEAAEEAGVPAQVVGEVTGDGVLRISVGPVDVSLDREELEELWRSPLHYLE
ncbi:phosphoribosylformylglycinamidine synthase subunit PurL [Methanopyrus kandleri]